MASDYATLAAISGVLKDEYLGPIRNQFGYLRKFDTLLEKNTEDVSGNQAILNLRVSGNVGIGFRGDDEALPSAGRQQTIKCYIPVRFFYARAGFTGPAIAASRKDSGSFARIMSDEMENLTKDARRVSNVYDFGDGSGVIAMVTNVASTVITVDHWSKLFTVGRKIDTHTDTTGGTKHADSQAITAIDRANLTITIATPNGTAKNDVISLEDSLGKVQMGLMGIADDGGICSTHQGIVRNTYPIWKAKVLGGVGGAGRDLTEELLMQAVSLLEEDEIEPNFAVGSIFQRNDLVKEMTKQRQFVNTENSMKLKGGIRSIEIADIPFTWDRDCPEGYTFVGDLKSLAFYMSQDLDWMQENGLVLEKVSGYDAYECVLAMYRELGCTQNNAWVRLEDINENRPSGF